MSNSNSLNKFWVGNFTRQGQINQVYWTPRTELVSYWQGLPMIGLGSEKHINNIINSHFLIIGAGIGLYIEILSFLGEFFRIQVWLLTSESSFVGKRPNFVPFLWISEEGLSTCWPRRAALHIGTLVPLHSSCHINIFRCSLEKFENKDAVKRPWLNQLIIAL